MAQAVQGGFVDGKWVSAGQASKKQPKSAPKTKPKSEKGDGKSTE